MSLPRRLLASVGASASLVAAIAAIVACAPRHVPMPGAAGTAPANGDSLASYRAALAAEGLASLRLRARHGAVTVIAAGDDSVRVTLAIGAPIDGVSPGRCRRPQAAATVLTLFRDGATVVPQVGAGRDFGCVDYWRIEVPARLAVDVRGEAASLRVTGVAGGARLQTAVGRIDARLPGGAVEAIVRESGDILVRSASADPGEAAVESRVGSAGLTVDGAGVAPLAAPGPGQRVVLPGAGRDRFTLRTEVGHARLEIHRGPPAPRPDA